ncbi:MAG: metallophosphoesterase [Bacillota bacterium]|nr:metallophosphoesterase [Bacillota bacterium]HHU42943.1 hypothetical protein [Clostridiales bacterium]
MQKYIIIIILFIIFFLLGFFIIGGLISSALEIEKIKFYKKENQNVLIRILHISDMHYPKNGVPLNEIIHQAKALRPDLIFLTGDIIDSLTTHDEIQELDTFFNELGNTARCYAVYGNHESINSNLLYYNTLLSSNNIILINDCFEQVTINEKNIVIAGLGDSREFSHENIKDLNTISPDAVLFLLAHRPEYWQDYLSYSGVKPLMTFSGHAHGGQFRFFGKGLYSPNQGFFPKYDSGLYKDDENSMIVSRGLGNSMMNLRLYNRFHMPFVEIKI